MRLLKMAMAALLGSLMANATPLPAVAARGPAVPPSSASTVKKCAKGEIWNKVKKKCIKTQSGILPDEDLYWQGRELALAGQYDWAIEVFSAMASRDDPEVLKFIGYSYRKSGRFDLGETYYRKALAIDPEQLTVREYLGEGYASIGRLDLARVQLDEIARRCGQSCDEYSALADAIDAAQSQ
jgi:tetratricopeptide (TPR) repeat protein